MTASATLICLSRRHCFNVDTRSLSSSSSSSSPSALAILQKKTDALYALFPRTRRKLSNIGIVDASLTAGDESVPSKPEAVVATNVNDLKKPTRTFKSVYGMARDPGATPWAKRLESEENSSAAPVRSFKSIYGAAVKKRLQFADLAEKIKLVQQDFFTMYPDEKINYLKHMQRQNILESSELLIMKVTIRDVFLHMQPSRTIVCALAPVPLYYSAKWAVMSLCVHPFPATILSVSLSLLVFYKYLSSICTQIRHDPRTSTYSAFFPFRCIQQVKFRKSHFRLISTKRDPFRTCHVLIKGRKAFCPKRCFVSHTYYDDLVCPASEMRKKI